MEVDHSGIRLTLSIVLLVVALVSQPANADQLRILSHNLNRLFDDVDDGNDAPLVTAPQFSRRLARAAKKLAGDFPPPHLIALQEIENPRVLRRLANAIEHRYGLAYRSIMAPNSGYSTIDSGYLIHPQVVVNQVSLQFAERRLDNSDRHLFSRPPLQLDLCFIERCLTVINLHLRSMRGITSATRGSRVAARRRQQAQAVATWVDRQQRARPERALMVVGDFNALTPSDRHVDVAGIIRGMPDNAATRLDSPDLVSRDLVDLTRQIPGHLRYSYVFKGNKQQLDYLFVSQPLANRLDAIHYGPIDYSFSDHAALYASFRWH